MGRAQVLDVDLVANASTIWRVVVTVKNRNARASTGCCLQHPRNQMRFGVMPLTQLTLGIRARSIEVTQANRLELIDPLIVMPQAAAGRAGDEKTPVRAWVRAIGMTKVAG